MDDVRTANRRAPMLVDTLGRVNVLLSRSGPGPVELEGDGLAAFSRPNVIFVADAHRDKGKRYIVRADEKLAAFLELESAIYAYGE